MSEENAEPYFHNYNINYQTIVIILSAWAVCALSNLNLHSFFTSVFFCMDSCSG